MVQFSVSPQFSGRHSVGERTFCGAKGGDIYEAAMEDGGNELLNFSADGNGSGMAADHGNVSCSTQVNKPATTLR